MSKSAEKSQSFRERRANFSIRIKSNGRMDQLPAEAIEAELAKSTIRETLDTLCVEIRRLEKLMLSCDRESVDYTNYTHSLNRAKGNLGNMKKFLMEAKDKEFCQVFCFCANQLLTQEALTMVRSATWELMGKPKKLNKGGFP